MNDTDHRDKRSWKRGCRYLMEETFLISRFPLLLLLDMDFCGTQEAQTYAEETGLLFMETSAKTAMNVNDLFLAIGEQPSVHPSELSDSVGLVWYFFRNMCFPPV